MFLLVSLPIAAYALYEIFNLPSYNKDGSWFFGRFFLIGNLNLRELLVPSIYEKEKKYRPFELEQFLKQD